MMSRLRFGPSGEVLDSPSNRSLTDVAARKRLSVFLTCRLIINLDLCQALGFQYRQLYLDNDCAKRRMRICMQRHLAT